MINSTLLAEAIADAKAVRATALANAKAALEEAFAPRFEAMFADKLKEEAEEDDENMVKEVEAPNQVDASGGEAKAPKTKPVTKGQPTTSKKSGTDFKPVQAGEGPKGVGKLSSKIMETAEEEEKEGKKMDEQYEEDDENKKMDEAGFTSEDLDVDEIIKELENEVSDEEEGKIEPAPEGGEGMPPEPEADVNVEPGAEADVEAEPGSEVNVDLGDGGEGGEEAPPEGMNAGGVEGGEEGMPPAPENGEEIPSTKPKDVVGDEDENINLEELLAALNEETEEEDEGKEEMDETTENHGVPKNVGGQDASSGTNTYPKGPDASKKQIMGKNHNIQGKGNIGGGKDTGKPMAENAQYKTALRESYKTIEFLRGQINEVNLLNAKLLYTNKLFKEFAGVLDDPYRMKIIESFDLTKNVREVKLAYALLAESLNFGTQMTMTHKAAVGNKTPSTTTVNNRGQVKQITEGFASKPVSSTKPSQLITEGNEMALRFKKLAGIKDDPKIVTAAKK